MSSEGILSSSLAGKNDCELCEKTFTYRHDLLRHQHTIHREKSFECHLCPYKTARKDKLVSHQKVHTKASSDQSLNRERKNETKTQLSSKSKETQQSPNLKRKMSHQEAVTPSKYPRLQNIIDPVNNEQFLNDIEKQENKDHAFIEFSEQYGEPWGDDERLKQLYKTHMGQIKDQEIRGRRTQTYLRYLNDQRGTLINNMETIMKEIYHHQSHAFKINLSFSFILQHHETLEYRYFYASNNEQLLKSPRLIRNKQDLQNLLSHLAAKDFPSLLKEQRPNTKWVIERIVNLRIHLVITTYPLRKPPHLPDYIKNNRYIIGLEKNNNNAYCYKDHFCFFHCLASGKFGKTYHNCNKKAKELFQDYCQHFRVKPQDFEAVELDEFPELEKYFEVQLFVMFLKEDGSAKTLSQASFPTKIYMNVYKNHLSYIKDIKMYSKQYICDWCEKVFAEMRNLNKHQSKCDGTVKYVFPGGVYKNKLSVFEELEVSGVRVREEDKHEKWFACFDFEAYQRDFDEKVDAGEENSLEGRTGDVMEQSACTSVV